MAVNIERGINEIENELTLISTVPIFGSIAGGAKIVLGTVQSLCGIVSIAPMACIDRSLLIHSWNHIKHGAGNIIAGSIEAIPFVAQGMYFTRSRSADLQVRHEVFLDTRHRNKFMPYKLLVEADCRIIGSNPELVRIASELFTKKLQDNAGNGPLSDKRQMELKEEAIRETRALSLAGLVEREEDTEIEAVNFVV